MCVFFLKKILIQKLSIHNRLRLFLIVFMMIYSGLFLQAQNKYDYKFKKEASKFYDMFYQLPKNYHGIAVQGFYIGSNNNLQSDLQYGIKNKKHKIVIAFALVKSIPTNTPRGKRLRELSGNPGKLN